MEPRSSVGNQAEVDGMSRRHHGRGEAWAMDSRGARQAGVGDKEPSRWCPCARHASSCRRTTSLGFWLGVSRRVAAYTVHFVVTKQG